MIITAGKFKGRKITAPDENITRPTLSKIRMSVFNTLQGMVEWNSFLDMFGGSGIMGLEALSRGFEHVTVIEKNREAFKILKGNYKNVTHPERSERATLLFGDSLKIVPKLNEKFDVIYIDPPYYSGVYEKSLWAVRNLSSGIVILEHVTDVELSGYEIIRQKKYGDKRLSFFKSA